MRRRRPPPVQIILYMGARGDQIDLHVNPSLFPPPVPSGVLAPQFKFAATDFWAQGLQLGLDYRY